jgi:hypothetical protein
MERPAKEAGWEIGSEEIDGGRAGGMMRVIAFVSDVYLSESFERHERRVKTDTRAL